MTAATQATISSLMSEAATLEGFLERLPETEILERASLQSRIEEIREKLKDNPDLVREQQQEKDNIHDEEITLAGELLGFFPKRRTFEFEKEDGDVIHGKIGPEIEEITELYTCMNQKLTATFHTRRVGNGKPWYQLKSVT